MKVISRNSRLIPEQEHGDVGDDDEGPVAAGQVGEPVRDEVLAAEQVEHVGEVVRGQQHHHHQPGDVGRRPGGVPDDRPRQAAVEQGEQGGHHRPDGARPRWGWRCPGRWRPSTATMRRIGGTMAMTDSLTLFQPLEGLPFLEGQRRRLLRVPDARRSRRRAAYSPESISPGTSAPRKSAPTETLVWLASTMSTRLGGMSWASVPEAAMTPGGHPVVVAVADHGRQRDQAHHDHGGGRHAGGRGQHRADHDDGERQPAPHRAHQAADGGQKTFRLTRLLEDRPHVHEERDGQEVAGSET